MLEGVLTARIAVKTLHNIQNAFELTWIYTLDQFISKILITKGFSECKEELKYSISFGNMYSKAVIPITAFMLPSPLYAS